MQLAGLALSLRAELYGLGEKVVPDMTCLSCYKTSCDFVPNCMDLISSDMVTSAVVRQMASGRLLSFAPIAEGTKCV